MSILRFLDKRVMLKGHNTRARNLDEQRNIAENFRQRWLAPLESGGVHPVIDRVFSMKDVVAAHQYMEANLNIGKIILKL